MERTAPIYVAGHTGLIGSAVVRKLREAGFDNLLLVNHGDLELTDTVAVDRFFAQAAPQYVVLAAGRVGGIVENQSCPADFMNVNLAIQLNVLRAAHRAGAARLILFASSCMYPRECPQPMAEGALLSGAPEPTSMAYAVSKLAGMQMCLAYNQQYGQQRFIPVIPNSVYGPNDNFDPRSGHVLSALMRRFHEAKTAGAPCVTLWGSGAPRREFVHGDDVASACLMLLAAGTMQTDLPLNIGTGSDLSIRELAHKIARVVGYEGDIAWDAGKPDGAPAKLLDSSRIRALGWQPSIGLDDGLADTYRWYVDHADNRKS
ncbi:GDP-L-fucose synthase [Trinickia caryophylli]|uniref:GDP-L-fucose synthase n=1 Tax=Trinickia caryophylli TaxID=28094 RepID=A0A1X7CNA5_TRICW|nr:GDP-L-fucose synthase [Trinickia caryophylli]PMS11262.1 GDP-L-fucose synthase [Trinickia caryophylli]TRX20115.1 GDP-L-fucose synthase [Trinickia caryophylli]WQE12535.1 GDP-L-fucose synthase [Trinickia caryophylli]SME99887.1 GDP-L-fucose synthase [Trinickia caryophylli]GLU30220.1 GDP-L-fucose synthase [Trinickia caryophylli]